MTTVSPGDTPTYPSRADLHTILGCVAVSTVTRIERQRWVWQLSTDSVPGYGDLIRWVLTALDNYGLIEWRPQGAPVQHAQLTSLGWQTLTVWNAVVASQNQFDPQIRHATEARRLDQQGEGEMG